MVNNCVLLRPDNARVKVDLRGPSFELVRLIDKAPLVSPSRDFYFMNFSAKAGFSYRVRKINFPYVMFKLPQFKLLIDCAPALVLAFYVKNVTAERN